MGVSKREFMHSTPKVLEAYSKAYLLKLQGVDRMAWMFCGNYVVSAVAVAVEACLAGKTAKGEYIGEPVLQKNKPLDEEEIQRQRELFVAQLCAMKTNFDNNCKMLEN